MLRPFFRPLSHLILGLVSIFSLLFFSSIAQSAAVEKAIKTAMDTQVSGAKSQQRINNLDDQTRQMLAEYRSITHQTETLEIYNQQLQRLLDSQLEEMRSIEQQIVDIEVTQREIVPLMLRMLESLESFIALDVPFLPEERQHRVKLLQQTLNRADVSVSEKFRRLIEAYQIENDYGRTIEAYRGDLSNNGSTRKVDFLRLGRVALYYQTLDGNEMGVWDKSSKQWEPLSKDFRNAINKGLRIARKQAAPDLLVLPIDKPSQAGGQ
ncbi:MAG: DUF3450 domain-containing protein [Pseudomonadales bacterium]|nr:DUF3450 domain-containing protein [Pseudomonadales bacterium]